MRNFQSNEYYDRYDSEWEDIDNNLIDDSAEDDEEEDDLGTEMRRRRRRRRRKTTIELVVDEIMVEDVEKEEQLEEPIQEDYRS